LKIIGNDKLISQIDGMLRSGRLFHACIISGPRGSGKKTLARYLAQAAVCGGEEPPCGRCEGCVKADKDIHPDIDRVKRERGEITIEQVRSLRASLYTRANEAPRRVSIIEEADKMNRNAQNALLTVLEEPPSAVLLILIAENEEELLPTIRSRCIRLRMSPLPDDLLAGELKRRFPSLTEENARLAAGRSGGFLGQAAERLDKEKSGYAAVLAGSLACRGKKEIIKAALPLEGLKREQISEALGELSSILAGAAALKVASGEPATCGGKKREYYPTEEEKLLSERLDIKEILRLNAECARLSDYCDANVGTGHITGALISLFSEVAAND
jgi:DNA polymerase-3 subunit delta'